MADTKILIPPFYIYRILYLFFIKKDNIVMVVLIFCVILSNVIIPTKVEAL